ncbi:MAG TPA: hypothetical protein VME69_09695 [Methylocella sp.]|nr:hypothetical protein [Methylocella sp.]
MSRLHTSFVLGYHGCDESIGRKAINGETQIQHSTEEYDWLGTGAYFWENDPRRAMEWAQEKMRRGVFKSPFVVGAVINLENCLDLTVREDLETVRLAAESFRTLQENSGLPMPENKSAPKDDRDDNVLRYLDCAVINHLHAMIGEGLKLEPYDTVRALLPEGGKLYDGAGFSDRTHCQIAVRNMKCIKGLFIPL